NVVLQCKVDGQVSNEAIIPTACNLDPYRSTQVYASTKWWGAHVLVHIEQLFLNIWLCIMLSYHLLVRTTSFLCLSSMHAAPQARCGSR
ncbi:hypothetical protein K523DRAFT_408682, partial [Schizophyllum commune Tattone D]